MDHYTLHKVLKGGHRTQITNYCFVSIKNKNKVERGLERWLSRQQHLLLSQRTWLQFPATYTVAHNHSSTSRSSDALFWPQRAPGAHTVHIHTYVYTKHSYTQNKSNQIFKKMKIMVGRSSVKCWLPEMTQLSHS